MAVAASAMAEKMSWRWDRGASPRSASPLPQAQDRLQAADHDLDATAAPATALVVSNRLVARPATRHAGLYAPGLENFPEPIGVPAAVTEQPMRFWQVVQQRCRTSVAADLPGNHEEAQVTAIRVGQGMKPRVHAAFPTSDQASEFPCGLHRLDVVRCALR